MTRSSRIIFLAAAGISPLIFAAAQPLAAPSPEISMEWIQQFEPLEGSKPDAMTAGKLVDHLRTATPTQREYIIGRLLPMAELAAEATVSLFAEPPLATRLAALELLEAWSAPVAGLDPWEPASITPQRLEALKEWAKSPKSATTAPANSPSTSSIASELARLVACEDNGEALLIRARLARFGSSILPEVTAAIRNHGDDGAMERLTALRYRLVCSDSLASAWPGGIDRLASRDSQVRRKAAQELQSRAKPQDLPLLRELFTDSEPFVRELALATIQKVGGDDANSALLTLLEDPDANVRAAVLKQLTENPNPEFASSILKYAQREQDADLVLHAVRALSAMKGATALNGLMALMQHSSWQVRAEAAERAKEAVDNLPETKKADVYLAMITLLADKDSFVVSRALECLQRADILATLEPMLKVAETHPDLAGEVVKAISSGRNMRSKAEPHLRKFCQHADSAVRAAAIVGLCQIATGSVDTELLGALGDDDPKVRFAATRAFYGVLEDQRPYATNKRLTARTNYSGSPENRKIDAWLKKFQAGKDRAKWMTQAAAICQDMLGNSESEHQLFAALSLVALSADPKAVETILLAVESKSISASSAAHLLLWLPAEQRATALDRLLSAAPSDQKAAVISIVSGMGDDAVAKRLWAMLHASDATPQLATVAHDGLRSHYVGERYYDPSALAALDKKFLLNELKPHIEKGADLERTVALALVALFDPTTAASLARSVREDPAASEALRLDAIQMGLVVMPVAESRKEAVRILASGDAVERPLALYRLVGLSGRLQTLRGGIYLYTASVSTELTLDNKPVLPTYPEGLDAKILAEIAAAGADEEKAMASYLMALGKNREALNSLVTYWRSNKPSEWRTLAYQAVAVANDDELTPVLQEIYASMHEEQYEARQFYWSIRAIKGPQILKLRKQIRDEVGMDNLR